MTDFRERLSAYRVLPVVTARDVTSTLQLAGALSRGGMGAIEVTLRTPAALEVIRELKAAGSELAIGAGTVTGPAELDDALAAGADFIVSPGSTPDLLRAARDAGIDLVPGVATASEVMMGLDLGYDTFKLFPAVASGGLALLRSLAGPFPQVAFCPTGGLGPDNFLEFLALPNVICCGGSWMVASSLVDNGDWETIESLTRAAMQAAGKGG